MVWSGLRRKGSIAAVVLAAGLGSAARADSGPEASPRVVTLEESLAGADAVPEVVIARAQQRAAEAGVRGAGIPAEPTLTLATKSITAKESVSLSVPFRWGGQKASAVSVAKADRAAASRALDATRLEARRLCRVAWYTLAAGEDRLRAADDQLARSERNRKGIADLLEFQRASRLDLARATAEAAATSAARADAMRYVATASAELGALLGARGERLSAGPERPAPPTVESLEVLRERARVSSPEIALAEAELGAADARVTLRERERRPATSVTAGADWNDPTQPGTDASIGLGITFPTRGGAALEAAHADRDRAAAALDLAIRRVEADLETARSAAEAARARFEAADAVERPAAKESAELTRIAYVEGRLDLFRLLDAERTLGDAERARAEAYRDWGAASADLERLAPLEKP